MNGRAGVATLKSGLAVGLLLAATEAMTAALTSHNLSIPYLLLAVVFDLALGLVAAALAAMVRRLASWRRGTFAEQFMPLAAGVVTLFLIDKAVLAGIFGGRRIVMGAAGLSVAAIALLLLSKRLVDRFARTTEPGVSCVWSVAFLVPVLVGMRLILRSIVAALHEPPTLAYAALMTGALAVALLAQDRWLARHRPPPNWLIAVPVLAVLAALGLAAVRRVDEPVVHALSAQHHARPGLPNIVLISVDTLRADHLSLYGYERNTTPNLSRLARESLVFTHAVSPGTWTMPGHAAMLTGRFPGSLGVLGFDGSVPPGVPLLAQRLNAAGYRTGAVVANTFFLGRDRGWGRGFGFYSDEPRREVGYGPLLHTALQWFPLAHARAAEPSRTAAEINRSALAWVSREESAPFFLFVNYMDAHAPYMPPDPWLDRYPGRLSILLSPPAVLAGDRDLTDEKLRHYRALYDGAVAYVDDQIGDLLARLGALGRLENALVIVTSDHGEFLGEHRLLFHIVGPYDPVHRIPLLVRYPGGARHGVEHGWVQLVDIVPTVLDVAGLAATSPVDGEVLPRVKHPILIQQFPIPRTIRRVSPSVRGYTGVYDGPWKLVAFDDGTSLLFNVEADPAEEHDLWAADPARAKVMRENLDEANRRFPHRTDSSMPSRELEERLKAGGYIW